MGFRKKANKAIKGVVNEELEKKDKEFREKLKELQEEYNYRIIPVIDRYGPRIELQRLPENKETKINVD